MRRRGRMRRERAARAAALVLVVLAAACMNIRTRAGQPVNTDGLQQLTAGQSRAADVQRALGDPFGRGRSYLPFQRKHVDMWSYYYELGSLEDARRTFLFVYLDGDVYQGHMWFSSLPEEHR